MLCIVFINTKTKLCKSVGLCLDNLRRIFLGLALKGIAGVYYFGEIFAVKTAPWLLKPKTRDWTLSRVLAVDTFGSRVRVRKLIKTENVLQYENTACGIKQ